ncbi:hypothetical protein ACFLZC_00320 [Patescibacteria group bacterium]
MRTPTHRQVRFRPMAIPIIFGLLLALCLIATPASASTIPNFIDKSIIGSDDGTVIAGTQTLAPTVGPSSNLILYFTNAHGSGGPNPVNGHGDIVLKTSIPGPTDHADHRNAIAHRPRSAI